MYIQYFIGALLAAAQTVPSKPAAPAKAMMAILEVQTTGVSPKLVPLLTDVLETEVAALNRHDVISGRDIARLLGFANQDDVINCTDSECLVEIGGALGVKKVLASHVGRVGKTYVVHIKLVDIETGKSDKRVYETVQGDEDVLLKTLKISAQRVLGTDSDVSPSNSGPSSGMAANSRSTDPSATTETGLGTHVSAGRTKVGYSVPVGLAVLGLGAASAGAFYGYRFTTARRDLGNRNDVGYQRRLVDATDTRARAMNLSAAGALCLIGGLASWYLLDPNEDDANGAGDATPITVGAAPDASRVPFTTPNQLIVSVIRRF